MKRLPEFDSQARWPLTFVIVSSCPEPWGGSEELWAQAAIQLAQAGHQVHIYKTTVDRWHPRISTLRSAGCTVTDLHQLLPWVIRFRNRVLPNRWRYSAHRGRAILTHALAATQPDLAIVAQGNNFDGVDYADLCRQQKQPYVLIAQKAVNFFFPQDADRRKIKEAYRAARHCFFVSQHNLALTRQQLSLPLPNASVVANPVHISLQQTAPIPMPPVQEELYRLACVARLDVLDKGQDLLLDVLQQPKWRSRAIHLTFFGAGPHQKALQELVDFMGLSDLVAFGGHVSNPAIIWQTHHALVLPSRSEGLPLALVEAMLCGRPAIATNAGGIAELLLDNQVGFLAKAASVDAIDEALERAWEQRTNWTAMGQVAARYVREAMPANPAALFSQHLLDAVKRYPTTSHTYASAFNLDYHSDLQSRASD
ncbi:glycosyltransferase [Fibrella arboris]|uniref:glycosyltransferase n=1 Tax=Fibrella arboris TaxID=3242486 RepID=UPI003522EB59